MAYEIHLVRKPRGISIEEWLQVVATVPALRIANTPETALNPLTDAAILVPAALGTVEVLTIQDEWVPAFRFVRDQISFKATDSIESVTDSVHIAASILANKLSAQIIGDEGEVYDWWSALGRKRSISRHGTEASGHTVRMFYLENTDEVDKSALLSNSED